MALRTITQFKNNITGGGARPYLFEIIFPTFPEGSISETGVDNTLLVKSAGLPASNISSIDVPFRGRILKVAGARTFDTWTITVINDTDFIMRTAFEQWMAYVNRLSENKGETDPTNYMKDLEVVQLGRDGGSLKRYKFVDCYPTNVSQIDLSNDNVDQIEEFTVEFQVTYWYAMETTTNSGDSIGAPTTT